MKFDISRTGKRKRFSATKGTFMAALRFYKVNLKCRECHTKAITYFFELFKT